MNNPIDKKQLLKWAGMSRTKLTKLFKTGYSRVVKSILFHGLQDKFPLKGVSSDYIVPSLKITLAQVEIHYGKSIPEAARALNVPYNTFKGAIYRNGLGEHFSRDKSNQLQAVCPICRTTPVTRKFLMCEPCKRGENRAPANHTVKPLNLNPIQCKVYEKGTPEFDMVAAECTPILEIKLAEKVAFVDRFN